MPTVGGLSGAFTPGSFTAGPSISGLVLLSATGVFTPLLANVPSVAGLPQIVAAALLAQYSLAVGAISYAASSTIPAGSVISQSPAAGSSVSFGSAINLVISNGPPVPVTPPNLKPFTGKNLPQRIIPPNQPMTDQKGSPTVNWWTFLLNTSQQAFGSDPSPEITIPVSASPFTYTAPANGQVIVSGGVVSLIQYSKSNGAYYPTGQNGGVFQVLQFDRLQITYSVAPSVTFFPR
jgi:hypothetical protein